MHILDASATIGEVSSTRRLQAKAYRFGIFVSKPIECWRVTDSRVPKTSENCNHLCSEEFIRIAVVYPMQSFSRSLVDSPSLTPLFLVLILCVYRSSTINQQAHSQ